MENSESASQISLFKDDLKFERKEPKDVSTIYIRPPIFEETKDLESLTVDDKQKKKGVLSKLFGRKRA